MASGQSQRAGALGLRLALAFAGVALAAIGVLAGLTAASTAADVSRLVRRQQAELTGAVAVAATTVYAQSGRWMGADLAPVLKLAERIGVGVQVRDASGRVVRSSPGYRGLAAGLERRTPVTEHRRRVGQVLIKFSGIGLAQADEALRADLLRAIAVATGLAAALALFVALAVSRRITLPVDRLIHAARARGRGQLDARAGTLRAPGQLRDLAVAFDQMADTLSREEGLRRNLIADVAHELRTPIAVLQAGHEALLDEVATPDREQLASLRDEVLRLVGMVDDLQRLASRRGGGAAADADSVRSGRDRGNRGRQPRPRLRSGRRAAQAAAGSGDGARRSRPHA